MAVDQILHAYVANEETYSDKETIIQEGSKNDWVYVILEGHVKIKKKTSQGLVTLATLKEGDVVGEMAFLSAGEGIHSESAIATEGPVRIGLLDTQRLLSDYEKVSPRLKDLISVLIKRVRAANAKMCTLLTKAK